MELNRDHWKNLTDRYSQPGPRRMLALDGGGIRGLITLGIVQAIEDLVAKTTGKKRLCDYFDYIAGTSTGAIIAAGLARGMTAADLISFYTSCGNEMFEHSSLLERVKYFYTADPLRAQLQRVFGAQTTLEPQHLQCLLLVVTKNVTTDSPWPISSNPDARYNDPQRKDCNLKIPLWQLVRASTAAPVFFPPEILPWDVGDPAKTFVFVDGGVTPYNNPAFLLYRMATNPAYRLNWTTGEKNLLLVSIGTGAAESLGATAARPNKNIVSTVAELPGELMYGVQVEQDIACRTIGRCSYGAQLDRELGNMIQNPPPLSQDIGQKFLYIRYNADLSAKGLAALGFPNIDPGSIQKMDATQNIPSLIQIGAAAGKAVDASHFGDFLRT